MSALPKEIPLDPDYVRLCYDEALSYANFVETRLNNAIQDIAAATFPALVYTRLHNVRCLVNDLMHADYRLRRCYERLCDVMEWDDDEAKAAGVTVREVKL